MEIDGVTHLGSESGTVLLVGAGASADYGFPTGERLLDNLISALRQESPKNPSHGRSGLAHYIADVARDLARARGEDNWTRQPGANLKRILTGLADDLENARPRSIDQFLAIQSDPVVDVGKAAIAAVLLDAESRATLNPKPESDWIRHLWGWMAPKIPADRPILQALTLNYDRCLQHVVKTASESFFRTSSIDVSSGQIDFAMPVHALHGNLGDLREVPFGGSEDSFEHGQCILKAAKNLRLLHEVEEADHAAQVVLAGRRLAFLGFAFHEPVVERLFPEALWPSHRTIDAPLDLCATSFDRTKLENLHSAGFLEERLHGRGRPLEFSQGNSKLLLRSFPVLEQPAGHRSDFYAGALD